MQIPSQPELRQLEHSTGLGNNPVFALQKETNRKLSSVDSTTQKIFNSIHNSNNQNAQLLKLQKSSNETLAEMSENLGTTVSELQKQHLELKSWSGKLINSFETSFNKNQKTLTDRLLDKQSKNLNIDSNLFTIMSKSSTQVVSGVRSFQDFQQKIMMAGYELDRNILIELVNIRKNSDSTRTDDIRKKIADPKKIGILGASSSAVKAGISMIPGGNLMAGALKVLMNPVGLYKDIGEHIYNIQKKLGFKYKDRNSEEILKSAGLHKTSQERAFGFIGDALPKMMDEFRKLDYQKIELLTNIFDAINDVAEASTGKRRDLNTTLYDKDKKDRVYDPLTSEYYSKSEYDKLRASRTKQISEDIARQRNWFMTKVGLMFGGERNEDIAEKHIGAIDNQSKSDEIKKRRTRKWEVQKLEEADANLTRTLVNVAATVTGLLSGGIGGAAVLGLAGMFGGNKLAKKLMPGEDVNQLSENYQNATPLGSESNSSQASTFSSSRLGSHQQSSIEQITLLTQIKNSIISPNLGEPLLMLPSIKNLLEKELLVKQDKQITLLTQIRDSIISPNLSDPSLIMSFNELMKSVGASPTRTTLTSLLEQLINGPNLLTDTNADIKEIKDKVLSIPTDAYATGTKGFLPNKTGAKFVVGEDGPEVVDVKPDGSFRVKNKKQSAPGEIQDLLKAQQAYAEGTEGKKEESSLDKFKTFLIKKQDDGTIKEAGKSKDELHNEKIEDLQAKQAKAAKETSEDTSKMSGILNKTFALLQKVFKPKGDEKKSLFQKLMDGIPWQAILAVAGLGAGIYALFKDMDFSFAGIANFITDWFKPENSKPGTFGEIVKKAGQWGIAGAGLGFLAGGPIGGIVGLLAGGAIGGVLAWLGTDAIQKFFTLNGFGLSMFNWFAPDNNEPGTMKDIFRTGGHWALAGAGIGWLAGGPLGSLAGALIGGAIGGTLAWLGNDAIRKFFTLKGFGEDLRNWFSPDNPQPGGMKEMLGTGSHWALAGAGIGWLAGGPLGSLAGALIGGAIGGVLGWLGSNKLIEMSDKFFSLFDVTWSDVFKTAKNWVSNLFGPILDVFDDGFQMTDIRSIISHLLDGFGKIVSTIVEFIGSIFGKDWEAAAKLLTNSIGMGFDQIGHFFRSLPDMMNNAALFLYRSLPDFVREHAPDSIKEWLNKIGAKQGQIRSLDAIEDESTTPKEKLDKLSDKETSIKAEESGSADKVSELEKNKAEAIEKLKTETNAQQKGKYEYFLQGVDEQIKQAKAEQEDAHSRNKDVLEEIAYRKNMIIHQEAYDQAKDTVMTHIKVGEAIDNINSSLLQFSTPEEQLAYINNRLDSTTDPIYKQAYQDKKSALESQIKVNITRSDVIKQRAADKSNRQARMSAVAKVDALKSKDLELKAKLEAAKTDTEKQSILADQDRLNSDIADANQELTRINSTSAIAVPASSGPASSGPRVSEEISKFPASATGPDKFIKYVWNDAKSAASQLDVDPAWLVGQAGFESGWGKTTGAGYNNIFNMKAGQNWKGETFVKGNSEDPNATWKVYNNISEQFQDYADYIKRKFPSAVGSDNAEEYFTNMTNGSQKYCPDGNYVPAVVQVVDSVKKRLPKMDLSDITTEAKSEGEAVSNFVSTNAAKAKASVSSMFNGANKPSEATPSAGPRVADSSPEFNMGDLAPSKVVSDVGKYLSFMTGSSDVQAADAPDDKTPFSGLSPIPSSGGPAPKVVTDTDAEEKEDTRTADSQTSNTLTSQISAGLNGFNTGKPNDIPFVKKAHERVKLNKVHPEVYNRLVGLAAEYHKLTGKDLTINSAYRTPQEQAGAINSADPGYAAKQGKSMHQWGYALDLPQGPGKSSPLGDELGSLTDPDTGKPLLESFGFGRPLLNAKHREPWHIEPLEITKSRFQIPDGLIPKLSSTGNFLDMKSMNFESQGGDKSTVGPTATPAQVSGTAAGGSNEPGAGLAGVASFNMNDLSPEKIIGDLKTYMNYMNNSDSKSTPESMMSVPDAGEKDGITTIPGVGPQESYANVNLQTGEVVKPEQSKPWDNAFSNLGNENSISAKTDEYLKSAVKNNIYNQEPQEDDNSGSDQSSSQNTITNNSASQPIISNSSGDTIINSSKETTKQIDAFFDNMFDLTHLYLISSSKIESTGNFNFMS